MSSLNEIDYYWLSYISLHKIIFTYNEISSHVHAGEPKIIGLPAELRAIEGQSFSFPSHVTGKPAPDVYWYLNSR